MADTKISALTELAEAPASTDEMVVVDKSDTTMAASGTDKRIQWTNIAGAFVAIATFNDHSARHDPGGADALTTATAGAIQPDDSAAEGSAASFARSDHKHSIVGATAGTIQPDDAAAEGSATSFARSDHKHAIDAATAAALTGTNAEGTSTSFARADHNHAMPGWAVSVPMFTPLAAPTSTTAGANNTYFALAFNIMQAGQTITGVEYKQGATQSGTVRSYLCNAVGTIVSGNNSGTAQSAGTINTRQRIPFDATYSTAAPALFWAVLHFTLTGGTSFMAPMLGNVGATGTNAAPNTLTITPADMTTTSVPIMRPY